MFRVATYNVHSCIGTDRRFAPERVADAIKEMDADVLALQELGWHHRGRRNFDQFAFLEEATGYHVIQGPTKFHARAHYGNAILTRAPAQTYRVVDLSWPFHIPRGCILAEITLQGRPLTIVNVHLGLSPWDRRRQVRVLKNEMAHHPGAAVLMGDLNTWKPNAQLLASLHALFPTVTRVKTFHARAPRAALDRIFLSPELGLIHAEAWRTPASAQASDHLPLIADIEWASDPAV